MNAPEQSRMREDLEGIFSKRVKEGDMPKNDSELLKPELAGFDGSRLTLKFPLELWQCNGQGNIQGGIISCMMDLGFGALAHVLSGGPVATVDMTTSYIRGIKPAEKHVTAEIEFTHIGRRMLHGEARVLNGEGRLAASASTNIMRL